MQIIHYRQFFLGYEQEQYRLAAQRQKDAQIEEQKRAEAGRRYLANILKKNDSKNSEAAIFKIQLDIAQKRIIELEEQNADLKKHRQK